MNIDENISALELLQIYRQVSEGRLSAAEARALIEKQAAPPEYPLDGHGPGGDLLYYEPAWEASPTELSPPEPVAFEVVFVLGGPSRWTSADRGHLDKLSRICGASRWVEVHTGAGYAQLAPDRFQIAPGAAGDYARLWKDTLDPSSPGAVGVVHLWSLNRPAAAAADPSSSVQLETELEIGLLSWVHLVQTFLPLRRKGPLSGAFFHPGFSADSPPIHSSIGGFALTLAKESSKVRLHTVDAGAEGVAGEALTELACRELAAAHACAGAEIRYIGRTRMRRVFRESLAARARSTVHVNGNLPLSPGGAYLITGGLGGLGRIFARYLAETYRARLVLAGRSALKPDDHPFLDSLRRAGAEVCYVMADVACVDDVARLVQEARRRYATLNGVLHGAGGIQDAFLSRKSPASFREVLAPKIQGALALDAATRDEPLAFFVTFSSLAAVSGNPGQSDYAAANRFLDEFAGWRDRLRERGLRRGKSVSINWPLWRHGGMRLPPEIEQHMNRVGLRPLEDEEGWSALLEALGRKTCQLGVLSGDAHRLRTFFALGPRRTEPVPASPSEQPGTASPSVEPAAPLETLGRDLTELVAQVLKVKVAELDPDANLSDYGVDSILVMEIVAAIEARYELVLDASSVLENQTLRKLTVFLRDRLQVRPETPSGRALPPNAEAALQPPPIREPAARVEFSSNGRAPHASAEPVAVVAAACRLPGCDSPEAFWAALRDGRNMITEVPPDRWEVDRYYSPDPSSSHRAYSKWGSFISGIDLFDAGFFGVNEADAIGMDPQQRILLELAQELFDRGCYSREQLRKSRTGIFVGGAKSSYANGKEDALPDRLLPRVIVNTIPNMMAGRLANFYDLRGPAEVLDTACSSSLVAIHRACGSLASGESDMAIAGGVTLQLDPYAFVGFSKAGVLARTQVPFVFDERANGLVIGEGAALVLLKPLARALEDGDPILALVLGSAVNNDGHTMGLTTPNIEQQEAVLEAAYRASGVTPDTIGYLEAHGTGTLLGDPIEVKAATHVFSKHGARPQMCGLGSVKSNLGHLFHAAGVASFLKTVLSLVHRELPPTLHCEKPHPRFCFEQSPFFPVSKLTPFGSRGGPRRAGVSSFGFGGTNCHVVLEEFVASEHLPRTVRPALPLTRFNRKRYWLDSIPEAREPINGTTAHAAEPIPVLAVSVSPPQAKAAVAVPTDAPRGSAEGIESFLLRKVAERLELPPEAVDPEASFDELGLDSTSLLDLARNLEEELMIELYPTLLFEYPNLRRLSEYLAQTFPEAFCFLTPPADPSGNGHSEISALAESSVETSHGVSPVVARMEIRDLTSASTVVSFTPQLEADTPEALASQVEVFLRSKLAERLNLPEDQFSSETNLMELGLDSVTLLELARSLEQEIGIELYPTLFFEYQNLRDVSGYFAREYGTRFAQYLALQRRPDMPARDKLEGTAGVARVTPAAPSAAEHEKKKPAPARAPAPPPSRVDAVEVAPTVSTLEEQLDVGGTTSASSASAAKSAHAEVGPPGLFPPVRSKTRFAVGAASIRPKPRARDIAVIGMAGRFPGSGNPDAFWRHLETGTDHIREIPPDHLDYQPWYEPQKAVPGKTYCKWGSFLDNVALFDAPFFRVSPQEARVMDPQLRMMLEVFHEAAEDAGCAAGLRGSETGVYVGACFHDYSYEMARRGKPIDPYDGTGNAATMLANRLSHFWDLKAPSLVVDTACSSSLVALHLACQALRAGECNVAFAGGANLILCINHYLHFCSIGALSASGRCHTFDERADGYVPAEVVAGVFLKPLERALEDGDLIHGVIRGTAVNHGGYTNTVTAPSPRLEAEVIVRAWRDAGLDPETISYIEAHGTGTKLGDPVEIEGIKTAFAKFTNKTRFCAVGSAKAHIGHAEGAAGIAGLIKVLLALRHRKIPAMPAFRNLNPLIRIEESPLFVNRSVEPWTPSKGERLCAGISSFGFGGTYAHVIVEEFPQPVSRQAEPAATALQLVPLSAKSAASLTENAAQLLRWLDAEQPASLADVAFTLQVTREAFPERVAFVASDTATLKRQLEQFVGDGPVAEGVFRGKKSQGAASAMNPDAVRRLVQEAQWETLAELWARGTQIPWQRVREPGPARLLRLPTYAFAREAYWFETQAANASDSNPAPAPTEAAAAAAPSETVLSPPEEITEFLRSTIAGLVGTTPAHIEATSQLDELGFDSIMAMHLVKEVREKWGVSIYSNEAFAFQSFQELSDYVAAQVSSASQSGRLESPSISPPQPTSGRGREPAALETSSRRLNRVPVSGVPAATAPSVHVATPRPPGAGPATQGDERSEKPIVFLLSTPRAGSTLLRVMLAGHSRLFCPPELHLLPFQQMRERAAFLAGKKKFLAEGLVRALMELKHLSAEAAQQMAAELEARGESVVRTYAALQEWAGERLLVDKSPSYGGDPAALERSRTCFPHARYLFLVRHPLAVMESFVRNRFDKMLGRSAEDPWALAEEAWLRINRNIVRFLASIPPERSLLVKYEDLAADPQPVAQRICAFLGIPFEPALLTPYEGQRMTNGVHEVSLSIGDPNFLKHDRIEAGLTADWKKRIPDTVTLSPAARNIAAALGYPMDENGRAFPALSPAQRLFLAESADERRWNIVYRVRFATDEPLDRDRFEQAWRNVIARHPRARTLYQAELDAGAEDARKTADPGVTPIEWRTLSAHDDTAAEAEIAGVLAQLNTSIDFQNGPLLKAVVVERSVREFELLWVFHHLLGDGLSAEIMLREVLQFYSTHTLPAPPRMTFDDYCRAAAAAETGPAWTKAVEHWRGQLHGPMFAIPNDGDAGISVCADEKEIQVTWAPRRPRWPAAAFDVFSVALYQAVAAWTGHAAPTISHRLHGRKLEGDVYDGVVGFFAYDVPLSLPIEAGTENDALLKRFRTAMSQIPAIPYPSLVLAERIPAAHQRTAVRLNYQPISGLLQEGPLRLVSREVRTFQPPATPRLYALDLIARVERGTALIIARYSALHHDESTIRRLLESWHKNILRMGDEP